MQCSCLASSRPWACSFLAWPALSPEALRSAPCRGRTGDGGALFLQQNDQKVPGAVLTPEVVALGSKLVCGAAHHCPRVAGPERSLTSCLMSGRRKPPSSPSLSQGHSLGPCGLSSLVGRAPQLSALGSTATPSLWKHVPFLLSHIFLFKILFLHPKLKGK